MKSKLMNIPNMNQARFSRLIVAGFAVAFGAIGLYLTVGGSASPVPPTVYTTSPAAYLPINTSFSVQVRENSATTAVNAVQANISYPASLLDLVSISTAGSAFGTEAQNSGANGVINIGRGTGCSTTCTTLTGDQLIVTLNFKTKTSGGAANVFFTSGTALVSSTTNQDILGSLSATAGFTVNVDTTAPTVNVTSPTNGSTLSAGSTVLVTTSATDADSVSGVDIYIDGVKKTTLTVPPYNYSWSTSGYSFGSHTIQAKAVDPSGNIGTSSLVSVSLADQTAPSAAIIAPTSGSFLKGTVSINATAVDDPGGSGIARVEFYVDGVFKAQVTASPYSYSWNTGTASNAAHSLTVKAFDNASPANTTTSTAISVTVDNSAPTTPGNFRTTSSGLNSISLAWNASSDNLAVINYRLNRNGTTIATLPVSNLSFTDSGLVSGTSYTYTIVALDAAGNSSATATLSASTITPKIGDINGDGVVNISDLSILLAHWNTSDAASDINSDGVVNIFDLSILLSHYGT